MASTYVNNLRLNEMATGDGSGTWGTTTNINLTLIGEALGYATVAVADASTATLTIPDGSETNSEPRRMYLKITGGGQACTVTLAPNTASKVWIIENVTSYTLTFTQGSGANVAILAGETKMIATDGAGSGAVVYDVLTDLNLAGTTKTAALTNAGALSNQGTVTVGVDDTGYDVKLFGATSGAYMLWDESADDLVLAGAAGLDIAGDIDVDGTANLDIVDIDGAVQIDGALTVGVDGTGLDVKFFGTTSGRYVLWDESNDSLDLMDSVYLRLGTGGDLNIFHNGTHNYINSTLSDADIVFKGNDGGSTITSLTLDMSAAGAATFSSTVNSGASNAVGIGGTPADVNAGELGPGYLNLSRDDVDNRKMIQFGANGSLLGSIFSGHSGSQVGIGASTTGISFNPSTRSMMPADPTSTTPQLDATLDIGFSSVRWKDLYLSGGAYIGGAVSANYLDDYEEGTWTPVFLGSGGQSGQVYSVQAGFYTKIGRMVQFQAYCTLSTLGTITTTPRFGGLPFTTSSTSNAHTAVTLARVEQWSLATNYSLYLHLDLGGTSGTFTQAVGGTSASAVLSQSNLEDDTSIIVMGTYFV